MAGQLLNGDAKPEVEKDIETIKRDEVEMYSLLGAAEIANEQRHLPNPERANPNVAEQHETHGRVNAEKIQGMPAPAKWKHGLSHQSPVSGFRKDRNRTGFGQPR